MYVIVHFPEVCNRKFYRNWPFPSNSPPWNVLKAIIMPFIQNTKNYNYFSNIIIIILLILFVFSKLPRHFSSYPLSARAHTAPSKERRKINQRQQDFSLDFPFYVRPPYKPCVGGSGQSCGCGRRTRRWGRGTTTRAASCTTSRSARRRSSHWGCSSSSRTAPTTEAENSGPRRFNNKSFSLFILQPPPQYPSDIWRAENEPLFARRITFHN